MFILQVHRPGMILTALMTNSHHNFYSEQCFVSAGFSALSCMRVEGAGGIRHAAGGAEFRNVQNDAGYRSGNSVTGFAGDGSDGSD